MKKETNQTKANSKIFTSNKLFFYFVIIALVLGFVISISLSLTILDLTFLYGYLLSIFFCIATVLSCVFFPKLLLKNIKDDNHMKLKIISYYLFNIFILVLLLVIIVLFKIFGYDQINIYGILVGVTIDVLIIIVSKYFWYKDMFKNKY